MADSQVPWGVDALAGAVTQPAWKSKPSWYLQVRDDKTISYPAQQFMAKRAGATVAEVPGSHAIYVSNPKAVAGPDRTGCERREIVLPGAATPMRLCSRARTASQLIKSSGKTGYGVNQRSNGRNCNVRSDMPLIVWNVRFRGGGVK